MGAQRRTIYDNYDLWDTYEAVARETLAEYDDNPSDDEIWNVIYDEDSINWDCVKEELEKFFNDGSTWILRGTAEQWNGSFEAGTVFNDFMKMLSTATSDCDYVRIYDENGHFYIECSHHDGTNHYEVKKVTAQGIKYLENRESYYNDKRSEQYVHDRIMERYSTLPRFVQTVYGC